MYVHKVNEKKINTKKFLNELKRVFVIFYVLYQKRFVVKGVDKNKQKQKNAKQLNVTHVNI